MSQWLGSGFGQRGSTSKRGAMTAAASALRVRIVEAVPRMAIAARNKAPVRIFRFIKRSPCPQPLFFTAPLVRRAIRLRVQPERDNYMRFRALLPSAMSIRFQPAAFLLCLAFSAPAHEIPNDAT